MTLAIALRNIPEGVAVGVVFGATAAGLSCAFIEGAVALAIGVGLQNFPKGFAVSKPLRRQDLSKWKSINYSQISAGGRAYRGGLGVWVVLTFEPIFPYALPFAAGAKIFVVILPKI